MDLLPELASYLKLKKWRWRPASATDIALQTCPFCGTAKYKLWINAQTTQWRCYHCPERGNLYKLKRKLGDIKGGVVSAASAAGVEQSKKKHSAPVPMEHIERWHARLLASQEGMAYVLGRGLTEDTVRHFKLGMQAKHGIEWLTIPHLADGVCHNVKFRSLPPAEKTFRRVKGGASVLFNSDCLAECNSVVLCEAETDAMSMWTAGVKNVVALTCGAETFLAEWYDLLADKECVTIMLDADGVGQEGARAIARRLGFDKCKNVLLPIHDANELLQQLGPQELARTIDTAEQFEVAGILHVGEVLMQCTQQAVMESPGLYTPWRDVNRLLGSGWHPGDLIVLSARVKTGKTTWSLNVARHLAMQGDPALVYCLEMSPKRLVAKLVAHHRRKNPDNLAVLDYNLARYWLRQTPLYFMDTAWKSTPKPDDVFETIKRHGIKFVVFDNLHFLCRSLQYLTNEIGQVTRGFKLLAEETETVVCLIAQPRKIQGDRVMKYDDLKDSSSIPADADQVILLHRDPIPAGMYEEGEDPGNDSDHEVLEPKTLVRIDASRFSGGGECLLHYEGATATFTDWQPNRPR